MTIIICLGHADTVALKYYIHDGRTTITRRGASSSGNNNIINSFDFHGSPKLKEARCKFH